MDDLNEDRYFQDDDDIYYDGALYNDTVYEDDYIDDAFEL